MWSVTSHDVKRGNNFGTLRLLFAALVVVSHSPELIDGNRSREILTRTFGTLSFGELAVDGFFLISGYLIVKSFQTSPSVGDYITRRVLRIYPAFVVAYLAALLIVAPLAGGHLTELSVAQLGKLALYLVILSGPTVPGSFEGLPYPDLNGATWTIPYEFRCYLLVVLFGAFASRASRLGYAALLIGLAALFAVRHQLLNLPLGSKIVGDPADMIRLAFVFFVGGAFYVWRDRIVYKHRMALVAAGALTVLLFSPQLAEPALAVFGGYLVFWYAFACSANLVSQRMDHSDPSYGLYLYAWPVQNLLIFYIPGISPWSVTAITLPVALMLGLLSWQLVEKPALRHKNLFGHSKSKLAGTRTPYVRETS